MGCDTRDLPRAACRKLVEPHPCPPLEGEGRGGVDRRADIYRSPSGLPKADRIEGSDGLASTLCCHTRGCLIRCGTVFRFLPKDIRRHEVPR